MCIRPFIIAVCYIMCLSWILRATFNIQPRCCRGISHKYRSCNGIMQFKITLCAMLQLMMALRLDSSFRQDTRLDNAPTSHRINAPGSQWSSRRAGVMWSVFLVLNTKRAAEFWRSCSFLTWLWIVDLSELVQWNTFYAQSNCTMFNLNRAATFIEIVNL